VLTQDEARFLLELLDQVNVRGVPGKLAVVEIMSKVNASLEKQTAPPKEQ
jgi:hypothetical protein